MCRKPVRRPAVDRLTTSPSPNDRGLKCMLYSVVYIAAGTRCPHSPVPRVRALKFMLDIVVGRVRGGVYSTFPLSVVISREPLNTGSAVWLAVDHVVERTGPLVCIELPRCSVLDRSVVSVIIVYIRSSPLSMLLVLGISSLHGNSKILVMTVSFSPQPSVCIWLCHCSCVGSGSCKGVVAGCSGNPRQ